MRRAGLQNGTQYERQTPPGIVGQMVSDAVLKMKDPPTEFKLVRLLKNSSENPWQLKMGSILLC
jgi:hypothetical protein